MRRATFEVILTVLALGLLCHFAKLVLITLMVAIFFAFLLLPAAGLLERGRVPAPVAAFIAVLLTVAVILGGAFYLSARAVHFAQELPGHLERVRADLAGVERKVQRIHQATEGVVGGQQDVLTVRQQPDWASTVAGQASAATEIFFALTFLPFMVYFMLSWRAHARRATVLLFPQERQPEAERALRDISAMMRSFLLGNLIIGLFMSVACGVAFGIVRLPYFYFICVLSGFLAVIPYLGVLLAIVPPLIAGSGQLTWVTALVVVLTVLCTHVFAINVLYPKLLGKRVNVNPLVATIALLFWGWLWGGWGLVLAVPITAAIKIVFDHVAPLRPYGAWLGD